MARVPVEPYFDRYTKALTKTTTRLEALLKVIVTPMVRGDIKPITDLGHAFLTRTDFQDPKENFILNYTFLIGDASLINFQKVTIVSHICRKKKSRTWEFCF